MSIANTATSPPPFRWREEERTQSLRSHGRSFYWASHFLSADQARAAACIYAFCRYADDVADNESPFQARASLDRIADALQGGPNSLPVVDDFLALANDVGIDLKVPRLLLHALRKDIGPVRMQDWQGLIRYSYGVASTVGLMMCPVLGVRDPRAEVFATDLGIAMQLTNIARDVLEDAYRGRVYLPLSSCPSVTSYALVSGDRFARRDAYRVVLQLLDCATVYYRSADRGMRYLPTRARAAILTASRLYEAIGTEVRRRPGAYWQRRAVVGKARRAWQTLRALSGLTVRRLYRQGGGARPHDPVLHTALKGLPGTQAP